MQLPRVIIAAVFFVIGALIAVPPLVSWATDSREAAPAGNQTTPTPEDSPTGTATASPRPTPTTPTPTPTRTAPTPTPTVTPTRTSVPPTPSPTRTRTVVPLEATIGNVDCPAREVEVTVRNTGSQTQNYGIERDDDSASVPGTLTGGASRTTTVKLREDRRTVVRVTWENSPVRARTLTANCKTGAAPTPPGELPETGPESAVLWARAATGGGIVVTGAIILWYGGLWPRRREQIFRRDSA
ncbi:hypothetical protein [Actinomadura flavalba]|uniref:hypothetical protein n=1 Tax=Actinomadura flavalba TaxID=1120938 RepID=UPI0003A85291|nr:hypothetical protein [Actinomadura flavalba]